MMKDCQEYMKWELTHLEVGNCDAIVLWQRICYAEKVLVVCDGLDACFKSELALLSLAHRGVNSDQNAVFGFALDSFKFTDDKGHEICAHLRRLVKMAYTIGDGIFFVFGLFNHWHIGQNHAIFRRTDFDVKSGFEGGLVPTWESTPGISRFELSGGCESFLAILRVL